MRCFSYGLLTMALLFAHTEVPADVYKCTDADGSLTYQQTPCPEQKVEKLDIKESERAAPNCLYANRFAVSTARLMRAGAASDEVFNRYGGLDSLSKGAIGVINYVYSFRSNNDVSIERIAGLTQAKCQARSLGDVSCEVLPISFTQRSGGCDADNAAEMIEPPPVIGEQSATPQPLTTGPASNRQSEELVQQCKKGYRDQIDAIDAEMRQGYTSAQGEAYRERLRALTEQLRDC